MGNGLAFSFDDILYHYDQKFFSTINQVNGAFTFVASSDLGQRPTAMEFNPDDGILYAALVSGSTNDRDLVTIDTITGKFTTIGVTVDRLTALAFGEIKPSFDGLTELMQSLELEPGIENSLLAKVNAAANAFENENINTATNILNSLLNAINAQEGKKISIDDAQELKDLVNQLIDFILE